MTTRTLTLLALAVPMTVAVIACSSAPAPTISKDNSKGNSGNGDNGDDTGSSASDVTSTPKPAPVATVAPAPVVATIPDAGFDAAPTPVQPPPAPTTQFCAQLSKCCGTLSVFQSLACSGTAIAGNETACGVELAVCNAGGINFGDDDDN